MTKRHICQTRGSVRMWRFCVCIRETFARCCQTNHESCCIAVLL